MYYMYLNDNNKYSFDDINYLDTILNVENVKLLFLNSYYNKEDTKNKDNKLNKSNKESK